MHRHHLPSRSTPFWLSVVFSVLSCTLAGQISNTSLSNKIIVGYQGWFSSAGDGSQRNDWNHWQILKGDGRVIPAVDIWPKMGEYPNTFNNGWALRDGTSASVFSAYKAANVAIHFKWMKDFSIDGAFVGRQTKTIAAGGAAKEFRDQVLKNVAAACVTHGRVFYINYDISEEESNLATTNTNGNVFDRIVADFQDVYANLFTAAERGRYVTIGGKPLIRIFGVGSKRNKRDDGIYIFSATQARDKLDAMNDNYTIMLGVNRNWRTLDSVDIRSDWTDTDAHKAAAMEVWQQANYIQPWSVNAFTNTAGADTYYQSRLEPDIQWGADQTPDIHIAPVIWPGFSWRNKKDGSVDYNQVPRGDGSFYWNNGYEAHQAMADKAAPIKFLTVAMFDEIDEGTAIMKVEVNTQKTPNDAAFSDLAIADSSGSKKERFITNVGGPNNEPDYFLWLTKQLKTNLAAGTPTAAKPNR